jgi:hypothetical protein
MASRGQLVCTWVQGAEARNDARVGNLAKYEWILVYAIDKDIKLILDSFFKDIKKTLREKHDCGTQDHFEKVMPMPSDFKDGKVWLMVKLGYTNPPRALVRRRLNRMDATILTVRHVHICRSDVLRDMTNKARKEPLILETLKTNRKFCPSRRGGPGM